MSLSRDYEKWKAWKRRSKPLRSNSRLSRNTRLNPRNDERRERRFERQYHSEERVRFVRDMGCVVCGRTPADNAHVRTGGMGMKADYVWTAPLCRPHHVEYDTGRETFEEEYGVDMEREAERVEEEWQRR